MWCNSDQCCGCQYLYEHDEVVHEAAPGSLRINPLALTPIELFVRTLRLEENYAREHYKCYDIQILGVVWQE